MARRKNGRDENDQLALRRRAEEHLKQTSDGAVAQRDVHQVTHEFAVYKVELELQNEELREARDNAEAGFLRYSQLFEFAPIGYETRCRRNDQRAESGEVRSVLCWRAKL